MKNKVYSLLAMVIAVLVIANLAGCGGGDNGPKHTPQYNMITSVPNQTMIFSYDMMGMMDKSKVRNSEDMPFELKMMMNLYFDKMFSSKSMGLKLEGNNHVVITADKEGKFDFGFVLLDVIDETKVKKGLKEFLKGVTEEEEGIKYLTDKYSGAVAAWDSLNFVLAFSEKENMDLKGKTKSILGARYVDGPDDKVLEDFLNRDDDMNALVYMDRWAKMADASDENFNMDENLVKLYDNGYLITSGNFDPGKIVFEMEVHAEELKNSKYNLLSNGPVSSEFTSYLSDGELIMFGTANVNIKALFDVVFQDDKMKKEFESEMEEFGLDGNTIKELFTGEVAASLIDMEMKPNPFYNESMATLKDDFFADMNISYVPKEIPHPRFLTTIGINDEDKMNNIVSIIPGVEKRGNYYVVDEGYMAIKNKKLFITSDEKIVSIVCEGGNLGEYDLKGSKLDTPLYGYFNSNLESLPEGFKNMIKSNGGNEAEELLNFFNEFESISFKGGFEHVKFEAILKDKTKNSLEVITGKMMNQIIENAEMFL